MLSINERVSQLRDKMKANNFKAYCITGTDAHQSEYVAPYFFTRAFISGFTGSAGYVIVTLEEAILWVDSRYYIQAKEEIKGSEFIMKKIDSTEDEKPFEYLKNRLAAKDKVAVDMDTISIASYKAEKAGLKDIEFVLCNDLLQDFWCDRQPKPTSKIRSVKLEHSGLEASDKLNKIRQVLTANKADYTFISALDDIAWITNLRGSDVEFNPVYTAFLLISLDQAILFTQKERFSEEILKIAEQDFTISPYESALEVLANFKDKVALYNDKKVSATFISLLDNGRNIVADDPSTLMKAKKNPIELMGMRKAHFDDAVSYVNFLAKLDINPNGQFNEINISDKLEDERKRVPTYIGPSFAPISGFKANGAMCHYKADEATCKVLDAPGLLVLDTGSQFPCGTTDITRTIYFGDQATEEEKRDYTLVLKGHLALSAQRFIEGTRGYQLDVLAKQFMWNYGLSFFHGTGHGIGCNLNVHEGPMNISNKPIDVALEEGMIVSNEPGIYKEGRHGIRIENLIVVTKDIKTEMGQFYTFETLTLVPYENKLIDLSLLTDTELDMINNYHKWVYEELVDHVDDNAKIYLKEACKRLER